MLFIDKGTKTCTKQRHLTAHTCSEILWISRRGGGVIGDGDIAWRE